MEAHLKLLQELAPKWLQVIQIARGKYIKIDKNMEINQIIADVNNLAKSRKWWSSVVEIQECCYFNLCEDMNSYDFDQSGLRSI